MRLAVYSTWRRVYGADEDATGERRYWFIAPAGLEQADAWNERMTDLYASQIVALTALYARQGDPGGGEGVAEAPISRAQVDILRAYGYSEEDLPGTFREACIAVTAVYRTRERMLSILAGDA